MNVGTYLLFTVPLVGGSLFLYDNLRATPRAPVEEAGLTVPAPRGESAPESGPMLQADPSAQIERLVREALERQQRERPAVGRPGITVAPGESTPGTLPQVPSIDLPDAPDGTPEGPAGTFDEKTLKTLGSYIAEIERREREERLTQMVNGQIDRLGVSLTDAQKKAVVETTLKYQKQVRDALRTLPPGEQNRDARTKAVQDVRDQYSVAIYNIAPAAEAEKLVNALGQGWRGGIGGGGQDAGAGFGGAGGGGGRRAPGGGGGGGN